MLESIRRTKTLLNQGIVRAFGKQDLDGATQSWERLIAIAQHRKPPAPRRRWRPSKPHIPPRLARPAPLAEAARAARWR
jgi:hypothetical protein